MGNERGPWIGSAWMVATERTAGGGPRPRVLVTWAVGAVLLLGALGAGGPHVPVTAALPPVDTSEVGATGRAPEAGVAPLPELLPGELPPAELPSGGAGVPETMLTAYRGAEAALYRSAPGCSLSWALVAGIGKVESSHAYGGAVSADGTTVRPILGPQLDGTGGNAAITDTDGGALDHDVTWDRAVGPTQFIPTSWRTYGADGNGDGTADPDNAFDAALATGRYLCAGGTDLATASGRHDAVFRYNHSETYVATVLRWADAYSSGALGVPDSEGGIPDADLTPGTTPDPTLAALPSPDLATTTAGAAPVPTTGLVGGSPVVPAPAAAAAVAAPMAAPAPAPAPAAPPASSAGAPAAPSSSGRPSTTTPPSSTPPSSTTTTPPSSTTPGTTTPGTTAPSSTTTPATPTPAARCTASVPAVAKAFGVPAAELKAAVANGPKAGQVTCTVTRGGKPLVLAVAATTASAPAPTGGPGVSRSAAGGRVVLTVPPSAGVPEATAKAALTKLAATW
ncbi:lytic murein transglycosylase [Actinomycetospora sp. OC33-EN08]|uniref:Lytic murein transglycosylase n=1 Tax=Actinomycetospora aurantiaca TaxID=3129233 RepID=A0ABU8MNB5_9PSEU